MTRYSKISKSTILLFVFLMLQFVEPLIASQGSWSANKAKMGLLKSALLAYRSDLGNFPFAFSNSDDVNAYINGNKSGLGYTSDTNSLGTDTLLSFDNLGLSHEEYAKRWRGPYVDGEPEDFMFDMWGMPFIYFRYEKSLYLWSAGQDGQFDLVKAVLASSTYEGDDMIIEIHRFRKTVINNRVENAIQAAYASCVEEKKYVEPTLLQKMWREISAAWGKIE